MSSKESIYQNPFKQSHKSTQTILTLIIILSCTTTFSTSLTFKQLTVTANSYIINEVTTYQIFYDRTQQNYGVPIDVTNYPVASGSTVTLTFPSTYTISMSLGVNAQVNSGAVLAPAFGIAGSVLTLTGLFTAETTVYNLTLSISNVLNPSPAITTGPFTGTIGADASQSINQYSVVSLSPAKFSLCYMTFTPKFVYRTSAMVFNLTAKTALPVDGTIQIQFPSNVWSRDISTTNFLPITNIMTCGTLSSNVKATIQCKGLSNQNMVVVSNMFNNAISAGESFIFTITNFFSPPTNQPADQIIIKSFDSNLYQINACNDYITDLIPNVMSPTTITISTNTGTSLTVNKPYTLRFSFTTVDAFFITDYFQIAFPTGSNFVYNSGLLSGGVTLNKVNSTFSSNILRMYMNTTLSIKTYAAPFTMYVVAGTYTAPPSTIPTTPFSFTIFRNSQPTQIGYQTLTAVSSTLSVSLQSQGSPVVNVNTSYVFSVTINDGLTTSGKFKIIFPSQVNILATSSACASMLGSGLASSPICTINTSTNTIELSSINSTSSAIGAQPFTLTIFGIQNPSSIIPSGTFQVQSYNQATDSSLVAVGTTAAGVTATQGAIDPASVTITSSSYKVLDQSATYSITLIAVNQVLMGGYFYIFIPAPIVINTNVLASSCKRGLNSAATQTTACTLMTQDSTGYLINFTTPLSTSSLNVGSSITFQLTSIVTNPPSTSPISSFKIYSFSSNGYAIDKIQSSLSIKMNLPTSLLSSTYTRDINKNHALATYSFSLSQVSQMQASSVIVVDFPPLVIPNANSTCSISAPVIQTPITCGLINSTSMQVTLPASVVLTTTTVTISINNIMNPNSFRPPGDFTISTFTSLKNFKYATGITSNKVRNDVASSFVSVTGSYQPGYLDTATTLTVNFQPGFEAPGYLQLSLPSYFSVPTALTCSQVANFNGACISVSSHTINITGTFTSNGMTTFQVSGFTTPTSSPAASYFILLNSFAIDGFQLDQSTNQVAFALTCQMPCKTCTSNLSFCLTCYTNSLITNQIHYDNVTNTCYSNCPNGFYENSLLYKCSPCDTNCLTCQTTPTFCTTCNSSTIYKYINVISLTNQLCVSQCQSGMFPDLTLSIPTCADCVNPCSTCTASAVCVTCVATYFFWNNTCTQTCPVGQAVGDLTSGKCVLCSNSCKTCSILIDNCTSCTSPLFLYQNKCISSCLAPLVYRPQLLTCGGCDLECKACTSLASNCSSCDPTSSFMYFHQNTCLTACPDTYYEGTAICLLCSSLNINCVYCINSTTCEKCDLGYIFLTGSCLATVPPGYVNINGVAQPCMGDCATCAITQTNCTSCKTLNLQGNVCQPNCLSGKLAINRTCTSCQYPCQTCSQNLNNCTSCLLNQSPLIYLLENYCSSTCPDYYFANPTTSTCNACSPPCLKCSDSTTCITCASPNFLFNVSSCIPNCPSTFVGINQVCQSCVNPCKTCTGSTNQCLTCAATYYFLNATNQCLLDCGLGLYKDFITQTCIACTNPCKTCVNSTSTCLSCLTGILLNSVCILKCPAKMYNNTNICSSCPTQCSSCTSAVVCTGCTSPNLLYNSFCITKCPETHAVVISGACTRCSDINCHKCFDSDVCYNCVSDYSLLNGACLSVCPTGYKTNGTDCIQVLASTLQSSGNSFPVPFTIATAVVLIACLMSKLQFDKTFLQGAIFSLLGILQTLALLYYIYLYYVNFFQQYPVGLYIALGSLGMLYVLNIVSIIQSIILCYDKKFTQWRDTAILNKCFNGFSIIISVCLSHKFKNILFCRLFAFHIFTALLDDVKRFKIFNIFSFISLIHSGSAIFSVTTIIKLADPKTQFFHSCMDVLIVTGLNIVFAFFNVMKSRDFFDQVTPDGLLLNKVVYGDQDSFNGKISMDGNDNQNQEGQGYYSKIQHTLASNQAFKFKDMDQSRQDIRSEDSMTNIQQQKQYQQISVQAYDMIDDKQPSNRVDFSTLKQNSIHDQTKFTTIFQNQDKSIQNTIQYPNRRVDQSIQKYTDISMLNKSIQPSQALNQNQSIQYQNFNQNQSIQYSSKNQPNNDQSIGMSLREMNNVSIQKTQEGRNDVSIQGETIRQHDQSGQYEMVMEDKAVQKILAYQDHSMQQEPDKQSWQGQNTIQMNDISIQKQPDSVQYQQIQNVLEQDENTYSNQNSNNIFYVQDDQGDNLQPLDNTSRIKPKSSINASQTMARQSLPQQVQQQFDIPSKDVLSHQQQLEQKILKKQQQLQKVRLQIKQKEKKNLEKEQALKKQYQQELKEKETQRQRDLQKQREKQQIKSAQIERQRQKQRKQYQQKINKQKKQTQSRSTMVRIINQIDEQTQVQQGDITSIRQAVKPSNFVVDMNKYIKQRDSSNMISQQQSSPQSIRTQTKTKPSYPHIQKYQKSRQVMISQRKVLQEESPTKEPYQSESPRKKPGMLLNRSVEKSLTKAELLTTNKEEDRYVYEIQNLDLEQQDIEEIAFQSAASTNKQGFIVSKNKNNNQKNNYQQKLNYQSRQNQRLQNGFQSSTTEVIPNKKLQPRQVAKAIYDDSNADKELNNLSQNQINQNIFQNIQHVDNDIQANDHILLQQQQGVQLSQDLPSALISRRPQIQSQLQNSPRLKQQKANLSSHEDLRRSFNNQYKKNVPNRKKVPEEEKISQVTPKFTSNIPRIPIDKTKKSQSLLANVGKNLLGSGDEQNHQLARKQPIHKNPLVTNKKWQHQNQAHFKELSSEGGDDSFVGQLANQVKRKNNNQQQMKRMQSHLIPPFETDRQQTSFRVSNLKGVNDDKKNISSSKNIRRESAQKQSAKQILQQRNISGQIQVHFDGSSQISPPKFSSTKSPQKQRSSNRLPSKPSYLQNPKQFQSQQIFGQQSYQQDSNDSPSRRYGKDRNNVIMGKMAERPENQDLMVQYYGRTSKQHSKSKDRNRSSKNIDLSKDKKDKNLEKIYMQRLDSRNKSRDKNRY